MRSARRCSRRRGTSCRPTVGGAEVRERLAERSGRASRRRSRVDADDRRARDGLAAAEEVGAACRRARRRRRASASAGGRPRGGVAGRPAQDLVGRASRRRARRARGSRPSGSATAATREAALRQAPDRRTCRRGDAALERCSLRPALRARRPCSGQEVEPVRLVQEAGGRPGDAGVPVLPDDPLRPRVDHDDAVVVVVVRGDHAVRPAHRERGLVEVVRAARRAERPVDVPEAVDDHDPARVDEKLATSTRPFGQQLGVGGVGDRRAHRPEQARRSPTSAVDPAADLGHEQPAVREAASRRSGSRSHAAGRARSSRRGRARRRPSGGGRRRGSSGCPRPSSRRSAAGRRRRACSGSRGLEPGTPACP